jgi:hypothetical protein
MAIDYRPSWYGTPAPDNQRVKLGSDADVVLYMRSTALSADAELTSVIEGTSDHPGVAANSLIISNVTNDGDILMAVSDGGNSIGMIHLDGDTGTLHVNGNAVVINEAWSEIARWDGGNLYIADTANAEQSVGLTILAPTGNGSEEAITLKHTDVAHGATHVSETDSYAVLRQINANGGLRLEALAETGLVIPMQISLYCRDNLNTDPDATARGALEIIVQQHDGSGGDSNVVDNGNLLGIRCAAGGAVTTRFLFAQDGTARADVAWATYDKYDDVALLESLQGVLAPQEVAGRYFAYNAEALMDAGLIGRDSIHWERGNDGRDHLRGMLNYVKLGMANTGAILQMGALIRGYEERLAQLEGHQRMLPEGRD